MRKALIGAGIGLAAALFALLLGRLPFIDVVELKTYDWRMRATAGSATARDDIVLVTIDEESIRGLEPLVGRWPWPRLVHAECDELPGPGQATGRALRRAVHRADRRSSSSRTRNGAARSRMGRWRRLRAVVPLVLAGDAVPEALQGEAVASGVRCPAGATAASACHADDRPVFVPPIAARRRAPAVQSRTTSRWSTPMARGAGTCRSCAIGARRFPRSLFATASVAFGHGVSAPADGSRSTARLLIDYRSRRADGSSPYRRGARSTSCSTPNSSCSKGQAPIEPSRGAPRQDRRRRRDRRGARRCVHRARWRRGRWGASRFTPPWWMRSSPDGRCRPRRVARGGAHAGRRRRRLGVIGAFVGPWVTTVVALALWGAITAFATLAVCRRQWYPLVVPLLALVLATFGDVGYEYFVEGREKRRVKRLFSRYVSKDVYEQLLDDPSRRRSWAVSAGT